MAIYGTMFTMRYILLRLFLNALGLVIAAHLVKGIHFASPLTVIVAAVVVGLVNALVRPFLFLATLPLSVVTLGLFTLVLNALMLALAAWLVPGFRIESFGRAFVGAIIVSLVSLIGSRFLAPQTRT